MYNNGPDEHYIDLACPFGKTNSALEFCPPVAQFAKSVAVRYSEKFSTAPPILGTHVDDIFGGFKDCPDYKEAARFREYLIKTGSALSIEFNPKVNKTPLPARKQVILGRLYDSETRRVITDPQKIKKYRLRIAAILATNWTTRNEMEKVHGCLSYVADVEPFGRPFLACLTMAISRTEEGQDVKLSSLTTMALRL